MGSPQHLFRKEDPMTDDRILRDSSLEAPEEESLPSMAWTVYSTVPQKLQSIQNYIISFQYNYTSVSYVPLKKSRGTKHICKCAVEIINAGLPIQCVEACYIGIYLTSMLTQLERIPLSFKSRLSTKNSSNIHRHIVLAIRYNGKWGAIGLSRRQNLMWKDLVFDSLYSLVMNYKSSYESVGHELLAVYTGLAFPHDLEQNYTVTWKATRVSIRQADENVLLQLQAVSASLTGVKATHRVSIGGDKPVTLPRLT